MPARPVQKIFNCMEVKNGQEKSEKENSEKENS
jgi:hypothetical protein